MQEPIAEEAFVCVCPSGERLRSVAAIGRPYQIGPDEWACPVSLTGLCDRLADIHGGSSLQALCLAASLLCQLLVSFVEGGGRLFSSDGESPFNVGACFSKIGERSTKPLE